jgi:hypothetical protein
MAEEIESAKERFELSFAPTFGRKSGVNSTRQQSEWPTRRPANEVTAEGRQISSTPPIFLSAKTSIPGRAEVFAFLEEIGGSYVALN